MPDLSKRIFAALTLLASLAAAPAIAQQDREARFAFVIGNDSYPDAPLPTAANDAGLVADALKAAAFDVTGARNLDPDILRSAYREFLAKVDAAGPDAVAFVYFSGYGVQFEGDDYLVPGGAEIARPSDIPLDAVRFTDLTRPLAGLGARAKVVVFDLAYPFKPAPTPGLALIEPDPGMLVAMNAAPGTLGPVPTGSYGAYAQALAEMIRSPGLPVDDVFDQVRLRVAAATRGAEVPWDESRIDSPLDFFVITPGTPAPAVTAAQIEQRRTAPIRDFPAEEAYAAALERDTLQGYEDFLAVYPSSPSAKNIRGLVAARREALTWRHTLDIGTPQAFWSYLRRYPRGPHAAEAGEILRRLAAAAEPPPDFAAITYDVPPPPDDEEVYFDEPEPVFYDADAAPPPLPIVFLPPPPIWWAPPPPPLIDRDDLYFLPVFRHRPEAIWLRPPLNVVAPPPPGSQSGKPPPRNRPASFYVAIPAALATGIAAGHLHNGPQPTQKSNLPGGRPPQPFIPPVTAAPGAGLQKPGGPSGRPISGPGRPAAGLPPSGAAPQGVSPRPGLAPVEHNLPSTVPGGERRPGGIGAAPLQQPKIAEPPPPGGRPPEPELRNQPPRGEPRFETPPPGPRPSGPQPRVLAPNVQPHVEPPPPRPAPLVQQPPPPRPVAPPPQPRPQPQPSAGTCGHPGQLPCR